MIDFDKEIKKFEPIKETSEIDKVIYEKDMTDTIDIVKELLGDKRKESNWQI